MPKIQPFTGLPKEMFEFFMAISFNNNTEFFHENHEQYQRFVRDPLYALADSLADTMLKIDPEIEVRPAKVVSRIRRDTRFSANKLPYRDHMWLGWRPAGRPKSACFGLYLEVNAMELNYGIGWYDQDPRRSKAIRRQLLARTDEFLSIATEPTLNERFTLCGSRYKRMKAPEGFPEALLPYYTSKGFYLEHHEELAPRHLKPDFVPGVEQDFLLLKGLYGFFRDLPYEGIDEFAW